MKRQAGRFCIKGFGFCYLSPLDYCLAESRGISQGPSGEGDSRSR